MPQETVQKRRYSKDSRRYSRVAYSAPLRVFWEESDRPCFAMGRCIDVSEAGLRMAVPVTIPSRTRVQFMTDRAGLGGSASVKNVNWIRGKYIVGLELTEQLPEKLRDALRDPVTGPGSI